MRPAGWAEEPWQFNLAKLIVGSEGSLAVVTAADLRVVPIPPAQGLVVLSFATIPAALERLAEIVATGPVAVEMLDRMILDLAAENPLYSHYLNFAEGRPAAVLAAQFYADSQDELAARADDLARRFEGRPGVLGIRKSLTNAARDDFWKVRKAGFSLADGHGGRRQADRLRRGYRREPGPAARVLRPLRGASCGGMGSGPRATATPTSAACTSGRSSTSRRPKAWKRSDRSPGRCRTWWSSSAAR